MAMQRTYFVTHPKAWKARNCSCAAVLCATTLALCPVGYSAGMPGSTDQQITVSRFVVDGADSLSRSQIEQVKSSVMGKRDSGVALMDTARHLLTDALTRECYIRSDIELEVVNASAMPNSAWMHVTVRQGARYRLRNFRVEWAQAFSAQEIQQQLPLDAMRRGDCSGLINLEGNLAEFYRGQGFPNAKVHSLVQSNNTQQFDLTLYIDEGQRKR